MSDTITLDFLGATLRAIQAEQRTLRMENELIRKEIGRLASREELLEVLRVLAERIGNSEALLQTRFDHLNGVVAQLATEFGRLTTDFGRLTVDFGQLTGVVAQIEAGIEQLKGMVAEIGKR